jgi:multimeric flavodoxin WrbA
MARELAKTLIESGATAEELDLNKVKINPCQACKSCQKGEKVCIVNDHMKELYEKLSESDVMVLATPVYWWGPSAQMKLFIDRWYAFKASNYKQLLGKKVVLILSYHNRDPILAGADLVTRMIKDICSYTGMKFQGVIHASNDEQGEVLSKPEVLSLARKMGSNMT